MGADARVTGERVSKARALLERCGAGHDLGDEQAVERADSIAAAAAEYAEASGAGNAAVLDEHLRDEFELRDADATMRTMSDDPYLHHVPMLTGGVGRDQVHRFYRDDWIPSWPPDVETTSISRTVGADQVVDELIVGFSFDRPLDPDGLPVTGAEQARALCEVTGG